MDKPPVLQFAEFFFHIGMNKDESIRAINCLEKGMPMGISMEVGLGLRSMESVDEAIVKAKQEAQVCEPVEAPAISQE